MMPIKLSPGKQCELEETADILIDLCRYCCEELQYDLESWPRLHRTIGRLIRYAKCGVRPDLGSVSELVDCLFAHAEENVTDMRRFQMLDRAIWLSEMSLSPPHWIPIAFRENTVPFEIDFRHLEKCKLSVVMATCKKCESDTLLFLIHSAISQDFVMNEAVNQATKRACHPCESIDVTKPRVVRGPGRFIDKLNEANALIVSASDKGYSAIGPFEVSKRVEAVP